MTLSLEAATDPNSKTVTSASGDDRLTSTAPFMPGTSGFSVGVCGFGSGFWVGFDPGEEEEDSLLLPLIQEIIPMALMTTTMMITME